MKVAALDLGTNSFLCLIVEGDGEKIVRVHKDLMQIVRLGQGVNHTGVLHQDALARAKRCLTEFRKTIDEIGVDRVLAVATSAARDAKNGEELFAITNELNIPVEIISGKSEAEVTYRGATFDLQDKNKTYLVVDVGGGSTEYIVGKGDEVLFAQSLNIGAVRLTEKFISHQPISQEEQAKLKQFAEDEINAILPQIQKYRIDEIIAVAGTPTAIAAIELGGFVEDRVNLHPLSREKLTKWSTTFAQTSIDEKKEKFHLGGRADIIFSGCAILEKTVELLSAQRLIVSTRGVRYGLALRLLSEGPAC